MSEEPDRPTKFLPTSTGLAVYRVFLVSICVVSLAIWTVTIKIFGIIFVLCLLGAFNEFIADPHVKLRASNRYIAPYRLFLFIWNGFRSNKG
ncbi:hypothetical protein FBZ99_101308 [Rhizobium sp. ERR 1071]|uniref:hypothetical protein n=1 Tax=Rhizobium sp. ERR 1071 TaxID=2572677 RepID=UPI00119AC300|nr:hypothetical protein [Rhizobium sp. ERR1071]TWB19535.1 hypothetical protein FBZ99_101308 [Rhizobium sp. ERR1071]